MTDEIPPFQPERLSVPLSERPEYVHSILLEKLAKQDDKPPIVFFTDIDNTYIAKSPSDKMEALASKTAELTSLLDFRSYPIIAVTGRDLPMVKEGIGSDDEHLPPFDVIGASVGTEIFVRQEDGSYQEDAEYKRIIEEDIGFKRDAVYGVCQEFLAQTQQNSSHLDLAFQPRDTQENVEAYKNDPQAREHGLTTLPAPQPYKISFIFKGAPEEAKALEERFKTSLTANGYPKIHVVVSTETVLPDGRIQYNLDVVPVTKAEAIDYMVKTYGCDAVVAGDSGNDTSMIIEGGPTESTAGIVVGNAKSEVVDAIDKHTVREERHFRIIQTSNGQKLVYVDPHGNVGPESLLHAERAFRLLRMFRRREKHHPESEQPS